MWVVCRNDVLVAGDYREERFKASPRRSCTGSVSCQAKSSRACVDANENGHLGMAWTNTDRHPIRHQTRPAHSGSLWYSHLISLADSTQVMYTGTLSASYLIWRVTIRLQWELKAMEACTVLMVNKFGVLGEGWFGELLVPQCNLSEIVSVPAIQQMFGLAGDWMFRQSVGVLCIYELMVGGWHPHGGPNWFGSVGWGCGMAIGGQLAYEASPQLPDNVDGKLSPFLVTSCHRKAKACYKSNLPIQIIHIIATTMGWSALMNFSPCCHGNSLVSWLSILPW